MIAAPVLEIEPRYRGFFDCFNRQEFFAAHDVLEGLWLEDRRGPDGAFYKGLIQVAGAFVHLQKSRPQPAASLLRTARANLSKYAPAHRGLNVAGTIALVDDFLGRLAVAGPAVRPLLGAPAPQLRLGRLSSSP